MTDPDVPPRHKWSEVDSFLHRKIQKLERAQQVVNPEAVCVGLSHIFYTDGGGCVCGKYPPTGGAAA